MNELPRQKLKEIIIQHGHALCDDPKRCEAFLRDYCGEYGREIFILISALKQGIVKDLLNSNNIPIELLLGRLTKQMQNNLGLTEEAARYGVESWAVVLDKMTPQQIQQPIIKPPTTISRNQQPIVESTHPKATEISQARQIDYINLERLLQQQNFRAADEVTYQVMLAVAKREIKGDLDVKSIDNFPCRDLCTIDKLWVKYSTGKFGFSVQKRIYQGLGGTRNYDRKIWYAWADKVVWKTESSWLYTKRFYPAMNFTYDMEAPEGHLPTPRVYQHWASTLWFEEAAKGLILFSRVETCKL
jgi:hypothetical protein